MASLASLTLRLARVTINKASPLGPPRNGISGAWGTVHQQLRFKTDDKSNDDSPDAPKVEETANLPHLDWVKFQRSITVEGFETGQTTKALTGNKKRGGAAARKKKARELLAAQQAKGEQESSTPLGEGQFPALRYSKEETERLLAEAYANIPPRMGGKKTRHRKREYTRWWRVRKARAKQKRERIQAHFRRMEKRSAQVKSVLAVNAEAPQIRERDAAYQKAVLRKWALTMLGEQNNKATDSNGQRQDA